MAKGAEKNKTNQMLNTAQGQSQNYTNNYLSTTNPERQQARENANDLYSNMSSGYKDLATNKGITPELLAALGMGPGGTGIHGGGVPVPNFSSGMYGDVQKAYRNFMGGGGVDLSRANEAMGVLSGISKSGGWSDADKASQNQLISGLTSMGQNGGLSPADMARMRGNGVFDEFSKTGGYSPADAANFRARATSVIPSIYANAKAQADQMGRVTGQYNPAAIARMSRQAGYDSQKAATDAEVQLQDAIRQGREWGASNVSSSENQLQGLRTGNMLQGLTSAASARAALLNSIAQNQSGAASSMGNMDISGQGLVQQGKMFGTSGLEGLADKQAAAQRAAASAGASNAAMNAANAKWLAEFGVQNQEAGLGGLGGLYTSSPAEVGYYDAARQGTVNNNVNNTLGVGQARMQNNPQRDWLSTITGIGGSVIGGLTGLGVMGGQKQPTIPGQYGYTRVQPSQL